MRTIFCWEILMTDSSTIVDIENFELRENNEVDNNIRFKTFMVPVDDIDLADNIRPFDQDFIQNLADSIYTQGQLQPCIGFVREIEDGSKRVVLIAGQHRYKAIEWLNSIGIDTYVMINLANRELTPEEIVEIQLTENLQNKMTPAQEAEVMCRLWHKMERVWEEKGKTLTVTAFARRVGRSYETVNKAIKYVGDVTPIVQELVEKNLLPYGHAVLLAEIDDLITRGDERNITDEDRKWKQIDLAQYFITKKFNYKQASEYLKRLREESKFAGPLFGDAWELMEVRNRILAIRKTSDKQGRAAAGWFVNMVRTADIIKDKTGSVKLSEAIHNALELLGVALEDFKRDIKPYLSEREFDKLFGE